MPAALLWLQAIVLLLAACGSGGGDTPRISRVDSDGIVLAFGDSLTYGSGATSGNSYPDRLAQLIGRRVVNAGIPGETTAEGLARLSDTLDEIEPQLVILCLGGNDMLRKLDRTKMKNNLATMIREIRDRNIAVVLIGVPEPSLMGLKAEPSYAALASEFGLPLENRVVPEVLGDRGLKSDTIHPNDQGYRQMAEALAALLKRAGAV